MKTFVQNIYKLLTIFLGVSALILPSSCGKLPSGDEGGASENGKGDASVVIKVASAPSTKSAKDGDLMVNLRVWMVDSEGKVSQYASLSPNAAEQEVTFKDVIRGDYILYFLANSTELSSYVKGSSVDDSFKKATLSLGSGTTSPSYSDSEGMPLSLVKECSVGPGVNRVSAEIVRVCGRIKVTVKNRTQDNEIHITSVRLSGKNPNLDYVFQQDDHSSPSGTTYGAFSGNSNLTRIEPGKDDTILSCYLFESCNNTTDTLKLSINGQIFDSGVTPTPVSKNGYQATGNSTNTSINTSSYYFIASASSPMQFLKATNSTTLALEDVGSDEELFVKDNIENYLWKFSSTGTSTALQNVGTGSYVSVSISRSWSWGYSYSASYGFSSSSSTLSTSTSTGRQFYSTNYDRYSYLYNNSGVIGVTSPSTSVSTATNTGWYLREATPYSYTSWSPSPVKNFSNTSPLTYTDEYGIIQPLKKVCRNDSVEVVVNMFYNPITSTFDFQVESWRSVNNETTFD